LTNTTELSAVVCSYLVMLLSEYVEMVTRIAQLIQARTHDRVHTTVMVVLSGWPRARRSPTIVVASESQAMTTQPVRRRDGAVVTVLVLLSTVAITA
jgi:hypothetical protein